MVTHMKTTIDIADSLFLEAKQLAARRETTFRAIVELGLRHVLESEPEVSQPFRLRKHTFRGNGFQPGLSDGDWDEIRRRAYEGRGG